jgi:hypothetical protein
MAPYRAVVVYQQAKIQKAPKRGSSVLPRAGLEPAQDFSHMALNHACLPNSTTWAFCWCTGDLHIRHDGIVNKKNLKFIVCTDPEPDLQYDGDTSGSSR